MKRPQGTARVRHFLRKATDGPAPRRVQVSGRSFLAVAAVWSVAVLYVAEVHVPKNVLSLPGQKQVRSTVTNVAPQGWAFFTKSPRDVEVLPYGQTADGSWTSLALTPHSSPRNTFGLDRASRSQGIEIALLLNLAEKKDWKECEEDLAGCLAGARPSRTVKNPSPEPTVCGRVALVQEKPVPWAWRDLVDQRTTPERHLAMDVTC
ncbi:SdpA family antimicrobial peptide system protein [Streptomyces rectiverticillatus]|uniref:SdpA family antimicrobial peptide system protein n=1 Tax=Streptomyces rectiverticillatus TaxID=173860 RepID=UPI001FEBE7A6|nr:SdpA family antimicrobial peptide system protein [Streptomyces rectiverticillatus]